MPRFLSAGRKFSVSRLFSAQRSRAAAPADRFPRHRSAHDVELAGLGDGEGLPRMSRWTARPKYWLAGIPLTVTLSRTRGEVHSSGCRFTSTCSVDTRHGSDLQRLRSLTIVAVLGAGVYMQFLEHGAPEATLGQHAFDGVRDQERWVGLTLRLDRAAVNPAWVVGVPVVDLVLSCSRSR